MYNYECFGGFCFILEKQVYLSSCIFFSLFFFPRANTEVTEETGHMEEQGEQMQGEEVKAGLSDSVSKVNE